MSTWALDSADVLVLDQPPSPLNSINAVNNVQNLINWQGPTLNCPIGDVLNPLQVNFWYYPSWGRDPALTGGCGANSLNLNIVTVWPDSITILADLRVQFSVRFLLGSQDVVDDPINWVEVSQITFGELLTVSGGTAEIQYNFGGTTGTYLGGSAPGPFQSPYCIDYSQAFGPEVLLSNAMSTAAQNQIGGGTFYSAYNYPSTGENVFQLPMQPLQYGVVVSETTRYAAFSTFPSAGTPAPSIDIYLCVAPSTQPLLPLGSKLAKASIRMGNGPGYFFSRTTSYNLGYNQFVYWLDIDWDKDFNNNYARFNWAKYSWESGEEGLYIVTSLDTASCFTTFGSTYIPQSFWSTLINAYVPP